MSVGVPGPDAPAALPSPQLAAELPDAVLANIHTANAWATYAQHDWTTYLGARTNGVLREPSVSGNRRPHQ
jgi:hypothetical protein